MEPVARLRKRQFGILWEITILLVVVFVAFGLVVYFVFRASENRLINKSIDKLKRTEAENIASGYAYVMDLLTPQLEQEGLRSASPQEIMNAVFNKETSGIQVYVSSVLAGMVESGMLGLSKNLFIFESWPASTEPFVFASSDAALVSKWEVPGYLRQAIKGGDPYIWMEDGIPEMGLDGEYLVVVVQRSLPEYGLLTGFVGIKSMSDQIAAINDFYDHDKRTTNLILLLLVVAGIAVITVITFIVLAYLIRTRITEPIEELSRAAGQVMEGDFDVRITIRSGEEFEQLKRAFMSMVDEWRKLMSRALEEAGGGQKGPDDQPPSSG